MKVAAQQDKQRFVAHRRVHRDAASARIMKSRIGQDADRRGSALLTEDSARPRPKKLTQFSSGLSRPFIQRPVMTMLLSAKASSSSACLLTTCFR